MLYTHKVLQLMRVYSDYTGFYLTPQTHLVLLGGVYRVEDFDGSAGLLYGFPLDADGTNVTHAGSVATGMSKPKTSVGL